MLLLPAPSSIASRDEMWALQQRLGRRFSTLSIDLPGFGILPRPKVDWRPDLYQAFIRHVAGLAGEPRFTVAAGHAAGYALAQAAERPGSLGQLCLLSPTWRGPMPTMTGRRLKAFRVVSRGVDLPIAGNLFYRMNVNGPVIGLMTRAHVYEQRSWMTPQRMAAKREVTEAQGARYASFRFVMGELDPFHGRAQFLDAAARAGPRVLVLCGARTPRKSKAEMLALGQLSNVELRELPRGKLSFYEEFPDETAAVLEELL